MTLRQRAPPISIISTLCLGNSIIVLPLPFRRPPRFIAGIAAGTMCSVVLVVEDPEGVLVRFEEPFRAVLFINIPIALAVIQVAFPDHQECFPAAMT